MASPIRKGKWPTGKRNKKQNKTKSLSLDTICLTKETVVPQAQDSHHSAAEFEWLLQEQANKSRKPLLGKELVRWGVGLGMLCLHADPAF